MIFTSLLSLSISKWLHFLKIIIADPLNVTAIKYVYKAFCCIKFRDDTIDGRATSLTSLDLRGNNIGNAGPRHLAKLSQITSLNWSLLSTTVNQS